MQFDPDVMKLATDSYVLSGHPPSAGSRDLLCKWLKELAVKVIADALFERAALNQTAGSIRLSQHGIMHTAD